MKMSNTNHSKPQETNECNRKEPLSEEDKSRARARNRDRMRAKRNEIKNDPEQYEIQKAKERERYHYRVAAGKIKPITELTSMEQTAKRKLWNKSTKKSRKEKLEREKAVQQAIPFTPANNSFLDQVSFDLPSTSSHCQQNQSQSNQKDSGKKRAWKTERESMNKIRELMHENDTLKKKIKTLTSCKEIYKKRYLTLKTDKDTDEDITLTPRKSVKDLVKREDVTSKTIQRELLKKRETCLCIQHENMQLLICKLKHLNIIEEPTPNDIMRSLCCTSTSAELASTGILTVEDGQDKICEVASRYNTLKSSCLQRLCTECNWKQIKHNLEPSENNDEILCEKWVIKKQRVIIKGVEKTIQKTVKDSIPMKKKELFDTLNVSIIPYMNHENNIRHQYLQIDEIKKNLKVEEALLHCDFSENYQMKYHREVKSAHFGISKGQLSLHTIVLYYRLKKEEQVIPIAFCTVSENLRDDPSAICVHLDPVMAIVKEKVPSLKTIHFLSDSSTTQYRSKKMFFFMATYLTKTFNVDFLHWHYTESGHGKGAPEDVAGCLKGTADDLVNRSEDLTSSEKFISCMKEHCRNITILPIDEKKIEVLDKLMPCNIPQLKGTIRIHQITWRKSKENLLEGRRLTCLTCDPEDVCCHYLVGQLDLSSTSSVVAHNQRLHYSDVYDSSSEDNEHM